MNIVFSLELHKEKSKITNIDSLKKDLCLYVPVDMQEDFKSLRYESAYRNSIYPSPTVSIIEGKIIQVWKGIDKNIKGFRKEVFESDIFLSIKAIMEENGWIFVITENVDSKSDNVKLKGLFPGTPVENDHVKYNTNYMNYRCPEFEEIPWADSIVVFGCSNVFGIGLEEKNTLCYRIQDILDIPVVNLGAPSSSMKFSLDNSILLKKNFGSPLAVLFVWTHHSRSTIYNKEIAHVGPWNLSDHKNLLSAENSETSALLTYEASKMIWKDSVNIHSSFFYDTSELLEIPVLPKLDLALDGQHPGRNTILESSKILSTMIEDSLNFVKG